MTTLPAPTSEFTDELFLKLAREIAIGHFDTETILERHKISPETWDKIQRHPRFDRLLTQEIEAWESAINTYERTRLKVAALVEEFLPEANRLLHLPNNESPLAAKGELFKTLTRIAGLGTGKEGVEGGSPADRLSITINLGADKIKFEKPVPPKTIEGEVLVDG